MDRLLKEFRKFAERLDHDGRLTHKQLTTLIKCLPGFDETLINIELVLEPLPDPLPFENFISWLYTAALDQTQESLAKDEEEVGKWRLLGDWEDGVSSFSIELDGCDLTYLGHKLHKEGPWMASSNHHEHIRFWLSEEGNSLLWQHKYPTVEKWPERCDFAARLGCITHGSVLLTVAPAQILNRFGSHLLGAAPQDTRLVAAGPPFQKMVPVGSRGAVHLGNVRLLEYLSPEAADVASGLSGSSREEKVHMSLNSIWEALANEHTILIKGSWVLEYSRTHSDQGLPRRQELPPEAIWDCTELRRLVEVRKVQLVALSYCWHTPEHPDPKGVSLQAITLMIQKRLAAEGMPLDDLALFIDWCSLYQKPRDADQDKQFKEALSTMHFWFAHWETMVWLLTKVPEGVNPYQNRGWTTFESGVASMLTERSKVLDLGKLDDDLARKDWLSIAEMCLAARQPPIVPEIFCGILEQKKFTSGKDVGIVKEMYEQTFQEVMVGVKAFEFDTVGWSEMEVKHLADTLPHCRKLNKLSLVNNYIGPEGAAALAAKLPHCTCLEWLDFTNCALDAKGTISLARTLPEVASLSRLSLAYNNIGPMGLRALAQALPCCRNLAECYIGNNHIGPDVFNVAVNALCKAFQAGVSVEEIRMTSNNLNAAQVRQLRCAWHELGRESYFLHLSPQSADDSTDHD